MQDEKQMYEKHQSQEQNNSILTNLALGQGIRLKNRKFCQSFQFLKLVSKTRSNASCKTNLIGCFRGLKKLMKLTYIPSCFKMVTIFCCISYD
jgi:hypothetical protein